MAGFNKVIVPTDLAFKNVQYKIGEQILLDNVSGYVPAQKLFAIMGKSGAGKTTLLDVLAGRNKSGTLSGYLTLNKQPRSQTFTQDVGYVMQDGAFVENLTVRESLYYAAKLRLPDEHRGRENELINSILETLKLTKVADSKIGDALSRGISGGEQRRLSIGIELILFPSLLFMDEPTTGLDALNSVRVISAMRELCKKGHTVITTIHQPRSDIFKMFDYLLLLDGGKTIYCGPAQNVVNYFHNLGYMCPRHVNPADFILDVMDDEAIEVDNEFLVPESKLSLQSADAVPKSEFTEKFASSIENEKLQNKISTCLTERAKLTNQTVRIEHNASLLRQFWVLFCRTCAATLRDPGTLYVRTIAAALIATLVGTIFFGQPPDERSKDARINSTIFLMCIFGLFALPALHKYIKERLLFQREVASGYYSAGPYFWASQAVEVPLLFVVVIIYCNITYWMIGLEPRLENFFFLVTLVFVTVNIAFTVAQLVSTVGMAVAIYTIWVVWNLLLGGFIVETKMMPESLKWLVYTSYFFYGFQALLLNEFEYRDYGHGNMFQMDFDKASKWENLGILTLIWVVVAFLTFLLLKFLNKEKR